MNSSISRECAIREVDSVIAAMEWARGRLKGLLEDKSTFRGAEN